MSIGWRGGGGGKLLPSGGRYVERTGVELYKPCIEIRIVYGPYQRSQVQNSLQAPFFLSLESSG